ncbi:IS66 family insertion sequence element accessory protein TnpB [Lactiplantibacillus plantarum]
MTNRLIDLRQLNQIYIVCGRTELRKGIDGLATLIQEEFDLSPFKSALFLFCGSRRDHFKGLYWEGDGFILLYKRFENGHLQWPRSQSEVRQLSQQQLTWLLDGLSVEATIHQARTGAFY